MEDSRDNALPGLTTPLDSEKWLLVERVSFEKILPTIGTGHGTKMVLEDTMRNGMILADHLGDVGSRSAKSTRARLLVELGMKHHLSNREASVDMKFLEVGAQALQIYSGRAREYQRFVEHVDDLVSEHETLAKLCVSLLAIQTENGGVLMDNPVHLLKVAVALRCIDTISQAIRQKIALGPRWAEASQTWNSTNFAVVWPSHDAKGTPTDTSIKVGDIQFMHDPSGKPVLFRKNKKTKTVLQVHDLAIMQTLHVYEGKSEGENLSDADADSDDDDDDDDVQIQAAE